MTHPTDLFADLVAGRLDDAGRARVADHLRGCAACAAEVRAAQAARDALRALPSPQAPPGLGDAAIAAARREPAAAPVARSRILTGLAAAAVIVIAIAVALPRVGDAPTQTTAEQASEAADSSVPGPAQLERVATDYDLESIGALADQIVAAAPAVASGASESMTATADRGAAEALACLEGAFSETAFGPPLRLIEGRFEGEPAYLGAFTQGPGAGQAPDTLIVVVASRPGCVARSLSSFPLLPE